ncbi:chemotaxis protein CheA [Maricaulis sp.]|uniref:chemotaxis protein CheA n=1 Tax=Maricaulis sp. TaxID=1486257 RepID=UPI0025C59A55|nr:chemotaxis protein CheA [Maricaulis sp.]
MNELDQFRQTFFEECEELLQRFEAVATTLSASEHDVEGLNDIFRTVHSIKAGAGAFKFSRLVTYSHEFENVMDLLRSGKRTMQPDDPDIIVQAGDILADLVAAARSGVEATAGLEDEMLTTLRGMLGHSVDAAVSVAPVAKAVGGDFAVRFRPHAAMYASANEPQLLIAALRSIGELSIKADLSGLPPLARMEPAGSYLAWTLTLRGAKSEAAIREVFEFVEDDCDLDITRIEPEQPAVGQAATPVAMVTEPSDPAASAATGQAVRTSSIRVDLDRVDRLVDMVGELVIAQAMALESLSEFIDIRHVRQLQALEDLTLRTRHLQEGVMAVRMQPVKALFSRFPRVVRDLSKTLGKSVRLELEGEATEVDKTIIEELSDPLTHMIRNCMDHGLETPDERATAGKAEQGVVKLSAEHRNGRILIRVSDDGRGLNPEKVLKKAVEKGLVEDGAELSKEEIEALIFMPGFSTASVISDVSGRGVGMDVVRRNIQKLGGRVTLDSTQGKGSTFTLALPLTLAVLDGMLVDVAGERYVVPLSAIIETVCPEPKQLRAMPDGGTILSIRGETMRLVDLCESLNLDRAGRPEPLRKLVVIVETEFGRHIGLIVDELLGQQQVVIKSLEANYRPIVGVAGTAILGDGRVRLILDIDGLAASSSRQRGPQDASGSPGGNARASIETRTALGGQSA